jgi:hypothetical protein
MGINNLNIIYAYSVCLRLCDRLLFKVTVICLPHPGLLI